MANPPPDWKARTRQAIALCALVALAPSFVLAEDTRPQVYGPIKFQMPTDDAQTLEIKLLQELRRKESRGLTAADLREHFVTEGAKLPTRLQGLEERTDVILMVVGQAAGVSIAATMTDRQTYAEIKDVWLALQDVGNCKFKRVAPAGVMPSEAEILAIGASHPALVTDTWEAGSVRIQLRLWYTPAAESKTGGFFGAGLRATLISPAPAM